VFFVFFFFSFSLNFGRGGFPGIEEGFGGCFSVFIFWILGGGSGTFFLFVCWKGGKVVFKIMTGLHLNSFRGGGREVFFCVPRGSGVYFVDCFDAFFLACRVGTGGVFGWGFFRGGCFV